MDCPLSHKAAIKGSALTFAAAHRRRYGQLDVAAGLLLGPLSALTCSFLLPRRCTPAICHGRSDLDHPALLVVLPVVPVSRQPVEPFPIEAGPCHVICAIMDSLCR